jgi:hypothetical protein
MIRKRKRLMRLLTGSVAALALPAALCAQAIPATPDASTRSGQVEQQEQDKSKHLTPLTPPHGEATFDHLQKTFIEPIFNPNGFSPRFGGLPTGGGFSVGPRFTKHDLLHEHLTTDTYLVGSTKKWYRGESSFTFNDLMNGHLEMKANGAYENAASIFYFGDGSNSLKKNQTNFRREFTTAHLESTFHLLDDKLTAGYTVGGLLVHVGKGDSSDYPSTNTVFTEANTPGLTRQTNFIVGTGAVKLDLTQEGFSNPKGLTLQAADSQFFDQGGTNASFHLLQTQATYSLPFWNGMRTLAFRARNETTFPGSGQIVPFYLQPTLGGPDTLRGYDRYRFYDNGSSLVSGEYRWSISGTLEGALFGDGGNVYQRPGLIGLRDLRGDGGFGLRVKAKEQTVLRFDVGFSPEGVNVWFVFNPIFGPLTRSF